MSNFQAGSSTDRGYIALNGINYKNVHNQYAKDDQKIDSIRQSLFNQTIKYPKPPSHGGSIDVINGVTIKDPWRALENSESEESKTYIKQQNECSFPFLHSNIREPLEESVHQSFNYPRTSCPMLQSDGYYYWMFNPGEASRDIMVRSRSLEKDFGKPPSSFNGSGPEIFFDPSKLPNTSLYSYSWSQNGLYFSAILQESGSDWQIIRTIDTKTCQFIDKTLFKSKFTFGACWIQDHGFIYKRILNSSLSESQEDDEDADGQFGLFYHTLNTSQADDIVIWQGDGNEAKSLIIGRPFVCSSDTSSDGRSWLFVDIYRNTNPECQAFLIELPRKDSSINPKELQRLFLKERRWLANGFTGDSTYVGTLSDNKMLFLSTTDGCDRGRIISVSSDSFDKTSPDGQLSIDILVPAHKDGYILQKAHLVGDELLILIYLRHVCAFVVFVDARTGKPFGWSTSQNTGGNTIIDVDEPILPKYSSISSISARSDSNDFFMSVETWTEPPYVLQGKYEKEGNKIYLERVKKIIEDDNKEDEIICEQIFYPSLDGIQIPMFLCFNKSLDRSKPNKVLLHAYGGFAVPVLPHFEPWFMAFVRQLGGILAIANIRGGAEYGKQWHCGGIGMQRINALNDFAQAARYLHSNKISKPSLTAIYGTSNGGTLVMINVNRNPELFGACMADVGVSDLIRFPLFTIGRVWQAEYGSPQDPKMTPWLHSISPLHNINQNQNLNLPSILVTTGDHDTRVIPGHSLKYLAELQHSKAKNSNPILGRIYIGAGHEANSKPTKERVGEAIDRLVFCLLSLKD